MPTHAGSSPCNDHLPRRVDRVATRNRGVIAHRHLIAAGVSPRQIDGLLHRGVIVPIHRGVYRATGTVMSLRRELIAATLAATGIAAASHRAALWLWGLCDEPPPIEISVATAKHPSLDRVIVHRSHDLDPDHLTQHRGVLVTKPARTLADVGCVITRRTFTDALEQALHRRLVTVPGLRIMIDEVAGRGRNGVGVLRTTLDQRALGDARPESLLEPLMARLCARHNVNGIEYQRELFLDGRRLRPDFLIRDAKLVIEVDGLAVHGTREALDADLERQNLLTAHGYQVLRYTVTHLRTPDKTASQILRTAAQRRTELARITPTLCEI